MQQQRVILHSEQIGRKGEIKYFQIPLQGKPIKVIAVEVSAFLFTDLPQSVVVPPTPVPEPPAPAPAPQLSGCPNPGKASIDPVSDTVAKNIRTQVFRIGPAVNPTFQYSCGVYSHVVTVIAVDGDTPASIAGKMATEVNNTSLATWSQYGSNNRNYKPTAVSNGDLLTLTTDTQHSFFASGTGECSAPAPPPPPPPPEPKLLDYDPLFLIVRNERAGVLSLQSPDATDIFYQCEAWRVDNNINYGDFTFPGELQGEWLKGRNRIASEVSITTASPILEAYYKDSWGIYKDKDISYGLNIFVWYENLEEQ